MYDDNLEVFSEINVYNCVELLYSFKLLNVNFYKVFYKMYQDYKNKKNVLQEIYNVLLKLDKFNKGGCISDLQNKIYLKYKVKNKQLIFFEIIAYNNKFLFLDNTNDKIISNITFTRNVYNDLFLLKYFDLLSEDALISLNCNVNIQFNDINNVIINSPLFYSLIVLNIKCLKLNAYTLEFDLNTYIKILDKNNNILFYREIYE